MSARFEFMFARSPGETRASHLRTLRQTEISLLVVDNTHQDREPKLEKPDMKHSLPPAAEPYTRL